ncbi:MAG: DPP IV N-terminal domain-containing protein [Phycisphaerae bacterium]|nr:DPP IV N-terminal domain-containing protein [Phycisphaerae bacterium]
MRHRLKAVCACGLIVIVLGCGHRGGKLPYSAETHPATVADGAVASPSRADPNFLEQYASTFRFRLGTPTAITCVPGGESVLFLRAQPRSFVQDLFEFDIASGTERVLLTAEKVLAGGEEHLTAEELARRERMRMASRGIASYSLSKDGSTILVPLSGRLFLVDRKSGAQRELKSDAGYPIDPRFSPDGTAIACVRGGEVYVTDVESGIETKITSGAGGAVENGLAEFVAQEEMDRREGYWWSPDGMFVAFQRTDTTGMEVFNIADPLNPEKEPQSWPYPRAGKANAAVRLGISNTRNGSSDPTWVQWDATKYPYLARVDWPAKGALTILVQNREQTEQVLLEVEPTTGGTRVMLTEHDRSWINLHAAPMWLPDGSAFLWISESTGEPRLELRDRAGAAVRLLTKKGFGLRSIEAVDPKGTFAYVTASADPTECHVWRVAIDTDDPPHRLTGAPGVHGGVFAKDGSSSVMTSALPSGEREWTVLNAGGRPAGAIRSIAENPGFQVNVEYARVRGASGQRDYSTALIYPRERRLGARYPVILSVYAGPGHQQVIAATQGMLMDQWLADHGFIVARVDGRGTPNRGGEWERVIKGNLIDAALEDQIDGLKALAALHPEMDMSRVGVYGWSFGGYFSAMAAMRRPDVFACGVAGAPVADWRDYDTHYTERFMGLPDRNASGYDASSVLTYCKDLRVPLLIIHGTADDNVYFMHSLKMCDALFRAGREFEFLALPGFTHMVPDPVVTRSLYGRIAGFFEKHLKNEPSR